MLQGQIHAPPGHHLILQTRKWTLTALMSYMARGSKLFNSMFCFNELHLKIESFCIIEIKSGNSEHFPGCASAGTEQFLSPRDVLGFPGHLHFHHSVLMFVSVLWISPAVEKYFSTPMIPTNAKIYHLDQQGSTFPEKWGRSFSSREQRTCLCVQCASIACLVWRRLIS